MNQAKIRNLHIDTTVTIGRDTVIGEEGFYWHRDEHGILQSKPHEFGVIINEDVVLGSHVSVNSGRWRDTVIGKGTKIDNHSHISHNVIIGKHCFISVGVILLGSCEIGDYCNIWSGAIVHQGVKVGDRSTVGAGTYLRRNIVSDSTVYGTGRHQVYTFGARKIDKVDV